MAGIKLLPCPWCGSAIRLTPMDMPWADGTPAWSIWHVDTTKALERKCPMEMGSYDTEAEAIEAWNTRAETATLYEYGFYLNGKKFVPERTCRMTDRGECSECGAYIVRALTEVHDFNGDMKRIDLRSHNYCPNCGAKVVSE